MKTIRFILPLLAAMLMLPGCEKHEETYFDTPFVRIEGDSGQSSSEIDHELDNLLSQIRIVVSASSNYFTEPLTVEYEIIPGDGLKEGTDYRVQPSTMSPLTFDPGTYSLPIRVVWYRNSGFDSAKDNTLRFRITGTSNPAFGIGLPGPDALKTEFVFTKK